MDLRYFVEWRPRQWAPAVKFLIGDPTRFVGKTVLEIGCRDGRMSCLFGLLGATVVGLDLNGVSMDKAFAEADRWGVRDRVSFTTYDGNPANIPGRDYDFIFTKSVLVVVPNLDTSLRQISTRLKADGELLAAENLTGGRLLYIVRWLRNSRYRSGRSRFHGVDDEFLATVKRAFTLVDFKTYHGLVAALRARKMQVLVGHSASAT